MNKKAWLGILLAIVAGFWYLSVIFAIPMQGNPALVPKKSVPLSTTSEISESKLIFPTGIPVLMYHSIGEEKNNDAVITRERFVEQMQYLYEHDYHPISLDDLHGYLSEKKKMRTNSVVITFDDGYRDTYETALPILKQYNFKSVLFIPVEHIGQHLSWLELQEMKNAGMEIAAHSYAHRSLGDLTTEQQFSEISRSKEILDQFLKQDTRYFCYPNGSYNQETLRLLREKGFTLAVTTNPGWAKLRDDPLTLRRIWMGNSVELRHFKERLNKEDYSIL